MKKIIPFAFTVILILAACSPKTASKATASAPATTNTATATGPTTAPKAGPIDPSDVQLTAAKTKFPDVTIDVLKKGYSIYTGACVRCHGAKNIEKRDEAQWVGILDDMAPKAR